MSPVRNDFCFTILSSNDNELYFGGIPLFYNFWDEFKYLELNENMRQKLDPIFFDLLCRIRLGIPTQADINELELRLIEIDNDNNIFCETAKFYKNINTDVLKSTCLFALTADVNECNKKISIEYSIKTIKISAIDFINNKLVNKFNQKSKASETAGLENFLEIGINSRVMLRRNINIGSGLCNGAIGTVKVIVKNQMGFITKIKILFDEHEELTEIERFKAQYEYKKNIFCNREQFPICLAWAITIHKSQGLTILSLIIDLSKAVFEPGMAYVGLSRGKELKYIYIVRLDPSILYCNTRAVNEYNRLRKKFLNVEELCEHPNKLPDIYKNQVFNNIKNRILKKAVDCLNKDQSFEELVKNNKKTINKLNSFNSDDEPQAKKIKRNESSSNTLKLRNKGTNSCYANSAVQSLKGCSAYLLPQVWKILKYY